MKKLLSWILHPWLLAALGLLALALLIWWAGPLVAVAGRVPLADAGVRIALIALLAGGWLAVQLASLWQARRANTRMIEGLAAAPGAGTAAGSGESAELGLHTHGGPAWKAFGRALYEEYDAGVRPQAAATPQA